VDAAQAAEIKVLGAPPVRAVVTDLAEMFRQQTGHTVTMAFQPLGITRQKLTAGEAVDVLILPDVAVDKLAAEGIVAAGTCANIARMGLGIAVRQGAPSPDISTPEALKQTLLSAKSIIYTDPALGALGAIHFARVVLPRLGIADVVKGKTVLSTSTFGGPEAVAKGEVELSVQGISEILAAKGVTLAGPLPKDLQQISTFSACVAARSAVPEAARAFIAFLARPSFRQKFAEAGLDYPE
jgi:molybdate transport system substrate-binding protein